MKYIVDFFEKEKLRTQVTVKKYPNGTKYLIKNDPLKVRSLHSYFNPLNELQINKLQSDVNDAQKAKYVFPEWYKDFLKNSNGMNLFLNSISLYGEQTPIIDHYKYGKIESFLERDNPDWMAPFNLRFTNSIKYSFEAQNRWLVIGAYYYDGTQIVWDFKTNIIEAMYALPVTISTKTLKKMREVDYEKMIITEWKDFETFFTQETARLSLIFNRYSDLTQIKDIDIELSKETLPNGHKDFIIS